ncbi:hypothetical protein BDW69DRAFT_176956 [Aspergillus filifer]
MSLIAMPNTPPCTDTSASNTTNADNKPRRIKRESSPYPGSSLLSRINRRFHNLTSPSRTSIDVAVAAEQNHTTTTITTTENPSQSQSQAHTPQNELQYSETETETRITNRESLSQQTVQELEDLQQRYQDTQAELARYRERCEELEELCRDFQVTFLSNYLESQKVKGEMRDVLQSSGMRWVQASGQNREGDDGDARRE